MQETIASSLKTRMRAAIGYQLLAKGCWLLAIGYRLSAISYQLKAKKPANFKMHYKCRKPLHPR